MPILRLPVLFLLLGLALPPVATAADPILAVLAYRDETGEHKVSIPGKKGVARSPFAGRALRVWQLRPGELLRSAQQPADRLIRLHAIVDGAPRLLCSFIVRYQNTDRGWRPTYQILEQPMVYWDGTQFKPIADGRAAAAQGLIQVTSTVLPLPDGYYPALEFGYTASPMTIDIWEIH
jgi:hypothetical protein